jgi:predicted NUDIX family phosphoesterase
LVRLPVALLDQILEVARYMDQNEGRLPPSAPSVIVSGHYPYISSAEEFKNFLAKEKARKLAEKVICGDEQVQVSDNTFKDLL